MMLLRRADRVREEESPYAPFPERAATGMEWEYVPADRLPREKEEPWIGRHLSDALCRLNPDIGMRPQRAEEVISLIRSRLTGSRDRLLNENAMFMEWLRDGSSLTLDSPRFPNPVRLIDYESPRNNRYIVSSKMTVMGEREGTLDLILFVNGLPLVIGSILQDDMSQSEWIAGAGDIRDKEGYLSSLFLTNAFSFVTNGKIWRYAPIGVPTEDWLSWRPMEAAGALNAPETEEAVREMLRPGTLLDLLRYFIFFSHAENVLMKRAPNRSQYFGSNRIAERATEGAIKKGLILQSPRRDRALFLAFAARKLRLSPLPPPILLFAKEERSREMESLIADAAIPRGASRVRTDEEAKSSLLQESSSPLLASFDMLKENGELISDRSDLIVFVEEIRDAESPGWESRLRIAFPNARLFGLTETPLAPQELSRYGTYIAEEDIEKHFWEG